MLKPAYTECTWNKPCFCTKWGWNSWKPRMSSSHHWKKQALFCTCIHLSLYKGHRMIRSWTVWKKQLLIVVGLWFALRTLKQFIQRLTISQWNSLKLQNILDIFQVCMIDIWQLGNPHTAIANVAQHRTSFVHRIEGRCWNSRLPGCECYHDRTSWSKCWY